MHVMYVLAPHSLFFLFFLVLDVFLAAYRAAATGAMCNRDAAWEELAAMCSRRMFVVRIM